MSQSIHQTFQSLRAANRIALMPFVPAGYPDLETTAACILAMTTGKAGLMQMARPAEETEE
jgi:tryptophan synthase alpha subunit